MGLLQTVIHPLFLSEEGGGTYRGRMRLIINTTQIIDGCIQ